MAKRVVVSTPRKWPAFGRDDALTGIPVAGSFEAMHETRDLPTNAFECGVKRLYKYRALGDSLARSGGPRSTQAVIESVSECQLYAATPVEMNDPFECRMRPGKTPSIQQYKSFVEQLASEMHSGGHAALANGLEDSTRGLNGDLESLHKAVAWLVEEHLRKVRIVSLTATNNNTVMWSHYAAGHRGVCLGFEVTQGTIFGEALEVHYETPLPEYTLGELNLGIMAEVLLLTKSNEWRHEAEWRILVSNPSNPEATTHVLRYEPHSLSEVIFGVRVCHDDEAAIRAACARFPWVRFGKIVEAAAEVVVEWEGTSLRA